MVPCVEHPAARLRWERRNQWPHRSRPFLLLPAESRLASLAPPVPIPPEPAEASFRPESCGSARSPPVPPVPASPGLLLEFVTRALQDECRSSRRARPLRTAKLPLGSFIEYAAPFSLSWLAIQDDRRTRSFRRIAVHLLRSLDDFQRSATTSDCYEEYSPAFAGRY